MREDWNSKRDELQQQISRIRADTAIYVDVRPPTAPGLEREQDHGRIAAPADRQAFARWLRTQTDRADDVGALARAAIADRAFKADASPEDLRARLRAAMADGEMFIAVDDAELDWLSF